MEEKKIDRVGVEGLNPDFVKLAEACHCTSVYANNEELFVDAFKKALLNNSPTIIVVKENYDWLD